MQLGKNGMLRRSGEPTGLKEEHDSDREKWGVTELTLITIVTTHYFYYYPLSVK